MSHTAERPRFGKRNNPDQVVILNPDRGVVLLVHKKRGSIEYWDSLSAGNVEGQDFHEALTRKITEETGLAIQNLKLGYYPPGDPEEPAQTNALLRRYHTAELVTQPQTEGETNLPPHLAWFTQSALRTLIIDPEAKRAIELAFMTCPPKKS